MKRIGALAFACLVPFATACSSGSNSGADDGPGGSSSSGGVKASAASGATSGSSSSSGSGGKAGTSSASSGSGGAASGDVVTIKMDSFDVPAGAEVYKCQNFANPFGGNGDVSEFHSHMALGSHHMLLFYQEGAKDGALEDCSGLQFEATPYSTQLPDDSLTFPKGVASLIPSTYGLRVQSHYLNTTSKTIHAEVEVDFTMAKPGTVTAYAGVLFLVQPDINIPPDSSQVVSQDCKVPFDLKILKASSHMHQHGTKFASTIAGKPFFDTTTWNDPTPEFFNPAVSFKSGDPIHFECTFENDGPSTLTFGESALTNEMCILGASYYPVPDPTAVTVPCTN